MKSAIFIPCYNCERQLTRLCNDLLNVDSDIYFINNCSRDNTLEVICDFSNRFHRNTTIINHKKNYGLGGSFKTALNIAHKDDIEWMIWLHGDDQAYVDDIPQLQLHCSEKFDAILGSRFQNLNNLENYSFVRNWGNRFLNFVATIILATPVSDLGSGLNIYRTKSLSPDLVEQWPRHMAFDINLLLTFVISKRMKFVPIRWKEVDQKSNAKNLIVAKDILSMLLYWKFSKKLIKTKDGPKARVYEIRS